jgi:DNA-directed RNA polymerase subunit M/transcription elongation factor TFIIS
MMLSALQARQTQTPLPRQRLQAAKLLHSFARMSSESALDLERTIMSTSLGCNTIYRSQVRRQAYNIACNPALASLPPTQLIHLSNEEFAAGTLVERVHAEEREQMRGFCDLLKEKYENVVRAQSSESILKCRNCGSSDITFSQKQTRGADESSTIFCSCQTCSKRWRLS